VFNIIASLSHEGFGFNTNIIETNLLNLAVVIGALVYFGGDFLGSLLNTRKENILKTLKDADARLLEATQKLNQAKADLELAKTKVSEITAQARFTAQQGSQTLLKNAESELKRLEDTKQETLRFEEQKAVSQIREQVIRLALEQAVEKLKTRMNQDSSVETGLTDYNISMFNRLVTTEKR
jgi:F-type H+-transporting ATPase subunit b